MRVEMTEIYHEWINGLKDRTARARAGEGGPTGARQSRSAPRADRRSTRAENRLWSWLPRVLHRTAQRIDHSACRWRQVIASEGHQDCNHLGEEFVGANCYAKGKDQAASQN
jgi:hypothetical protein